MGQAALFEQDSHTSFAFARHETFHLRYAWLKKAYDAVQYNDFIFSESDAHITLGVGKNMARSMRYWALAYKVLEAKPEGAKGALQATELGHRIFSDTGLDPYLEREATLWLLHWQLLRPTCDAPSWYFFFNQFNEAQFDSADILLGLQGYCLRQFATQPIAESSLRKDINCIIRTYLADDSKGFQEDSLDSPFVALGLLQAYDKNHYAFHAGRKANLPNEIIVACALDYAARSSAQSIAVSELAHGQGSLGKAFRIGPSIIEGAIEEASSKYNGLDLASGGGLVQLAFEDAAVQALEILQDYYRVRKAA